MRYSTPNLAVSKDSVGVVAYGVTSYKRLVKCFDMNEEESSSRLSLIRDMREELHHS